MPTPPVPEDLKDAAAGPVVPVVRFEAPDAGDDGTVHRFEAFLLRADTTDAAAKAFESWARETWRGFEIAEWRDLGNGRTFTATVEGGKAFGAVLAEGKRHAGLFLTGGAGLTDAGMIRATGTWLFLDPDPAAPLRVPPGWKVRETQHYRIRFQDDPDFAAEVGRHLEAISAELRRLLPLEPPDSARRSLDVRIFANAREFEAYASANGVEGAEAYFSPAQNELVAHLDARSAEHTIHVLYHEATHQYLRDVLGKGHRLPIWLDEGLGEVFYAGTFGAGGAFAVGVNEGRLREVRAAAARGKLLGLEEMFAMTREEFYAEDAAYAQGWSVAWFLLTDPRTRGVIPAWLEALRETGDAKKAQERALGHRTVAEIERDWRANVNE